MDIFAIFPSDAEVFEDLRGYLVGGREALIGLLRCLHLVEERKLYLQKGATSLFGYCRLLGFSECESWRRATASRLIDCSPLVASGLRRGCLHLTGLAKLQNYLKKEPRADPETWLRRIAGKSANEVEELLVRHGKKTPCARRPTLRPVRTRSSEQEKKQAFAAQKLDVQPTLAFDETGGDVALQPARPIAQPSAEAPPVVEVVYQLKAQLDATSKANLETIQALLRHRLPHGDLNDILRVVLQEAADRLQAKKGCALHRSKDKPDAQPIAKMTAPTLTPQAQAPAPALAPGSEVSSPERVVGGGKARRRARGIPRAVRRTVYRRDGGRCTWKNSDGSTCGDRAFLEYNHRRPFALGGRHTVENLELLCRTHNQHAATNFFGEALMGMRRYKKNQAKPS